MRYRSMTFVGMLLAVTSLAKPDDRPKTPVAVPDLSAYRAQWALERPRLAAETVSNRTGAATIAVRDAAGRPLANAKIRLRLARHVFEFGCNCLVIGQLKEKDAAYEAAFTNLFNLATTTFCRGVIEKMEGVFAFEDKGECVWRRPPPDRSLAFCRKNGLRAKGQPLLAGSWHPKWARERSPEECRAMYDDYFTRVAKRYGDAYSMFDVVNEAFLHKKFQLYTKECEYVDWAFENAQSKFPKTCRLCINEASNVNDTGATADRYYNLVRRIRAKGIRLDGVGFQFHLFSNQDLADVLSAKRLTPQKLRATYDRMAALGVPMYITEITIPSTLGGTELGEKLQAEVAENFYRFWFARPGFAGIIWWNLCDGAAWKGEGGVLAGLIDADMRRKPVYDALENLIRREWTTDVTVTTDGKGCASFRGYFGDYEATLAGKTASFVLTRDAKNISISFK